MEPIEVTVIDEMIEGFCLEAEAAGEPVNERHLASLRRHRSLLIAEIERETGQADVDAAA